MLIFKTVRYKNFLATGNAFTEIKLNNSPKTLIIGKNGAGKTTLIEAICFALFNKSFRNVNKSQLLNSVNNKALMVELEFEINGKEYLVKRGIKPNVFEIYCDGNILDQEASVKDTQNYLEENIIRMSYKAFTQIVVLGTTNFVQFMQLTLPQRREIIEDILDIGLFSDMNELHKTNIGVKNTEFSQIETDLRISSEKVSSHESFLGTLEDKNKQKIVELKEQIETYEKKIIQNKSKLETLQKSEKELSDVEDKILLFDKYEQAIVLKEQIHEYDNVVEEFKNKVVELETAEKFLSNVEEQLSKNKKYIVAVDLYEQVEEYENKISANEIEVSKQQKLHDEVKNVHDEKNDLISKIKINKQKIKDKEEEKGFYSDTDVCSTCGQDISEEFKEQTLTSIETDISKCNTENENYIKQGNLLGESLKQYDVTKEKLNQINNSLSVDTNMKDKIQSQLTEALTDVDISFDEMKKEIEEFDIDRLNTKLEELISIRNELNEAKNTVSINVNLKEKSEDSLSKLNINIGETKDILGDIDKNELDKNLDELKTIRNEINEIKNSLSVDVSMKENSEKQLKEETSDNNIDKIKNELAEYKKQEALLEENRNTLNEELKYMKIVLEFLKDTGVKTRIINKYLPIMNQYINKFLSDMNFFVTFVLDEKFNETIKSRHRDTFTYANFSEGEKQRIDLALLFTWRMIAKMKNSVNTNLLILDEVFDSSLDEEGIEFVNSLINTFEDNINLFVISHKTDSFEDNFRNIIKFEKKDNYSVMV